MMRRTLQLAIAGALWLASATVTYAQPLAPIRYTLRFTAPATHYVEVEAAFPTDGRPRVDLMMPIWTPGSYLAREYARHVEAVAARAADGRTLTWRKTRKNRWQVETAGVRSFTLSYRVYSREMSVRTNWVEDGFAMLNGAATFITLVGGGGRAHDVVLQLPEAWHTSITALPAASDGAAHHYLAPDFDTLVDSPIVAGNPMVREFEVSGRKHYLVNEGEGGVWDGPRSVADVEKIVRAAERQWGALPYEKYVFFNMLTGTGGGLEHRNSTMLMASRWSTSTRQGYLDWLSLVAHEYTHAWNVKRLRPVELGPFDYENEVYTTSLWVAEGFTDYYADLLVRRADLCTQEEYLAALGKIIEELQTTPGRLVQPAASASFDAWIKQYRPDENSPNTAISYYTKGAIIAFLLDAKIRAGTGGQRTLDDGMRTAFARYSGEHGYTREEFRRVMEETADADLGGWFTTILETADEVDYGEALHYYGLRFAEPAKTDKGWLGIVTRADNQRLVITQVRRGTPAYEAGLNVDDEILAIDGLRVLANQWETRVSHYRPGTAASITVSRRERLLSIPVTFGEDTSRRWKLEVDPEATPDQQRQLAGWLAGK